MSEFRKANTPAPEAPQLKPLEEIIIGTVQDDDGSRRIVTAAEVMTYQFVTLKF
jgi:hypothetical protein